MIRRFTFVALAAAALATFAVPASADSPVTVVRAQFTSKIDQHKPADDGAAITTGQVATYWVEVNNPNDATQVQLVWKLDGTEVSKQTLDVGKSPRWRTWGMCATRKAHTIEVQVLDKDGHELKSDKLEVASK